MENKPLEELLDGSVKELQPTKEDSDAVEGVDEPADAGGVEVEEIEVAGIVKDKYGNVWAIPAENVDDLDDLSAVNPFEKMKMDPNFHYQLIGTNHVTMKRMEGFVPVLKEEVGLPDELSTEYGQPTSSVVSFMDATLCKIPKVLAERRRKARVKEAQRIVAETEPSEEMLARATRADGPRIKSNKATLNSLDKGVEGAPVRVRRTSRVSQRISG